MRLTFAPANSGGAVRSVSSGLARLNASKHITSDPKGHKLLTLPAREVNIRGIMEMIVFWSSQRCWLLVWCGASHRYR